MTRLKGELSKGTIDSKWPRQVALPTKRLLGSGSVVIDRFLRGMEFCPRHHDYDHHNQAWTVFCCSAFQDAQYFAQHLGGEMITIEERKRREKNPRRITYD